MPSRRLVHPLTGKANSLRRAAEIVFVVVGLFSSETAELVAQPACGPRAPCVVSGGTYLARVPARWDGRSPLPAVVYFHGLFQVRRKAIGASSASSRPYWTTSSRGSQLTGGACGPPASPRVLQWSGTRPATWETDLRHLHP